MGWMVLCVGIFYFMKYQRDYKTASYTSILLFPFQPTEYRVERSKFLLELGKKQFDDVQYLDSFYNMRTGLEAVPQDNDARFKVVQCYLAVKRSDLAVQTLLDGLPYNITKRDYVQTVLMFLFNRQEDDAVVKLCQEWLAKDTVKGEVRRMLVLAQASAHWFRGRYDRAREVLKNNPETAMAPDARLLEAQILWSQGEEDAAIELLANVGDQNPDDTEIYKVRVAYLGKKERIAEIRSLAVLEQLRRPKSFQPHIDYLYTLNPGKESKRYEDAINEYFEIFDGNQLAFNGLAGVAVQKGDVKLAKRLYSYCKARNMEWRSAAIAMLESNIVAKQYSEVLEVAKTIVADNEQWAKDNGRELDALKSVANYALGDKALSGIQLESYITSGQIGSQNSMALAERMLQVGAIENARIILAKALEFDEFNQAALTRLIELDLQTESISELIPRVDRLLTMRMPSRHILSRIRGSLESDIFLLEQGRNSLMVKLTANLANSEGLVADHALD